MYTPAQKETTPSTWLGPLFFVGPIVIDEQRRGLSTKEAKPNYVRNDHTHTYRIDKRETPTNTDGEKSRKLRCNRQRRN